MNDIIPLEFEAFVRHTLKDLRDSLTDAQQTINGIEFLLNADKGKIDEILHESRELAKTMATLPALTAQTNLLLTSLNQAITNEMRDTRKELANVNRENSNKGLKTVGWMLAFFLVATALYNGYNLKGMGAEFSRPVVKQLEENREAADDRAIQSAKALIEAANILDKKSKDGK